uniref:Uncharacterized protein n=1 Tax=Cucumis melo TaxID=3656 RepID=A0A9I9EH52_CUCME
MYIQLKNAGRLSYLNSNRPVKIVTQKHEAGDVMWILPADTGNPILEALRFPVCYALQKRAGFFS